MAGIKLGFEFMVLTAARTIEVRLATWDEIDMEAARWTVPPDHMKAKRVHRVPLSHRAVELLGEAAERFGTGGLLFPGPTGKPYSGTSLYKMLRRLAIPSTAHGFRSSFRDWAAEKTDHPREVVEAALAHVVKDKVEAAYRRTDLFERRRRLMEEWAEYLAGPERWLRGLIGRVAARDGAQRPFPGASGAFRVFYGPSDRLRSTIACPRGVRTGPQQGAPPSQRPPITRPKSLPTTA